MEMLPPAGAAELATKQDVVVLGAELRREMAELRSDLIARMADMSRTLVVAMVTLWLSSIAVAFTVARVAG